MGTALKHGAYLGGFLAAYGLAFRLLNLGHTSPLAWVFYLALPIAAFLSLTRQAKRQPQTFLQAVMRGSVTVLAGSAIYAIYVYGFNAFIDDTLITTVRVEQLAEIDASDPKAEKRTARVNALTTPPGFAAAIFLQLLATGVTLVFFIAPFTRGRKARA